MKPNLITLDVRADLRAKREPFSKIMEAVAALRVEQSLRILEQAVARFPGGPHRSQPKQTYKLPKGSYYSQVETPRGLLGTYIVSDGEAKPYRVKYRSPNFSNLSVLNDIAAGHKVADLITIMSTLDLVIPDIDR